MEHQIEKYMKNPLFENITANHLQAMLSCLHSYTRNYNLYFVFDMVCTSISVPFFYSIKAVGTAHNCANRACSGMQGVNIIGTFVYSLRNLYLEVPLVSICHAFIYFDHLVLTDFFADHLL